MNNYFEKTLKSNAFIAFLMLFAPVIISILLLIYGETIGIPKRLVLPFAGMFFPYFQLIIWILWIGYSIRKLVQNNKVDSGLSTSNNLKIKWSVIIFCLLIFVLIINSIIPYWIEYPIFLKKFIMYTSFGFSIIQFYLFFALLYGFWVLSKTLNQISPENKESKKIGFEHLMSFPFSFRKIHRQIRLKI